jgi:hypothetical protein
MQPLVQSAIDAANRGENDKALELCKQALAANPNDVDAWLVVAAVVEQPERKRQCLNRVLSLDPTNQIARDELLDMDRAAMGGAPLFTPEPVVEPHQEPPASQPTYQTSTSAFEPEPVVDARQNTPRPSPVASQSQAKVAPRSSPQARIEKPLVFKYPLFWRILMYFPLVFFGCIGLLVATQNIVNSLPFLFLALVMVLVILLFSPKVEISETGIRASSVFSSSEAKWNEIKRIQEQWPGRQSICPGQWVPAHRGDPPQKSSRFVRCCCLSRWARESDCLE